MSKKKKRKRRYADIELNVMPFIDVFSLLNTFLLMSAVFLSIGVIDVQIPFLTNAPPEKKVEERSFDVKVDMEKDKIEVTGVWSKPPLNEQKKQFKVTKEDIASLHKFMIELRRTSPENDRVSFFTEDDVIWKDISHVLDAIKVRSPNDPVFQTKGASDVAKALAAESIFPKVVMSSVML